MPAIAAALNALRNLFRGRPAQSAPLPRGPGPDTPGADARQWARATVEHVRTASVTGVVRFLPYLDRMTEETDEIRRHYPVMLKEPTLKSALHSKVLAVASEDVQAHPEDPDDRDQAKLAELVGKMLRKVRGGTRKIALCVLAPAVLKGWSLSEVVLKERPERDGPFKGKILVDRVKSKNTDILQLIVDAWHNVVGIKANLYNGGHVFQGDELQSFILFSHDQWYEDPHGQSDFRAAYRAFWIKDTVWKLRALFLRRYTTPHLKGTYADVSQKQALEDAFAEFDETTWLTVPVGALVEALDIATRGTADYDKAIADCDREMLTAVCGAYLQQMESQGKDPRGDTEVHKEISQLYQWALADALGQLVGESLVGPWVRLNYHGLPPPTVTWGSVDDGVLMKRAQLDKALQEIGLQLSAKEGYRYYGRQRPADPQDVLTPKGPGGGGGPPGMPGQPPGPGQGPQPGQNGQEPGAGEDQAQEEEAPIEFAEEWDAYAEALAFTGEFKDKAGRRRCYQDGKQVRCEQIAHLMKGTARGAPQKAAPGPAAAKQFRPDPDLHPKAKEQLRRLGASLKEAPGVALVQKHEYLTHAQDVLKRMSPAALERFAAGLHDPPVFVADPAGVKKALKDMYAGSPAVTAELEKHKGEIGGCYAKKGGRCRLVLDGGHTAAEQARIREGSAKTGADIYAHEFGHAIDGPDYELSRSKEWQAAFAAEIRGGQLTNYARGKPSEGFAEFGRLLLTSDPAAAKKRFPRCYAFWAKRGLVAEGGASFAEPAGEEGAALDELFGARVELPEGMHADVLLEDRGGPQEFGELAEHWHAPWEDLSRFAEEDWIAWTLKSGPRKGQSVYKNTKTGKLSDTKPGGKKAPAGGGGKAPPRPSKVKAKDALPAKPTLDSARQKVAGLKGAGGIDELAAHLAELHNTDLQALKKELEVRAGGTKAAQAQALAKAAYAKATGGGGAAVKKPLAKKPGPDKGKQVAKQEEAPKGKRPAAGYDPGGPGRATKTPPSTPEARQKVLDAFGRAPGARANLVSLPALADATGLPVPELHAAVQDLRKQGVLTGSAAEGRGGISARDRAHMIHDAGGASVLHVSKRPGSPAGPATTPASPDEAFAAITSQRWPEGSVGEAVAYRLSQAHTFEDRLDALGSADVRALDPIVEDEGLVERSGIQANEYLRQAAQWLDDYQRAGLSRRKARAFVGGMQAVRDGITERVIPGLRKLAGDGVRVRDPVTGRPVDFGAAADFYERHALPALDALVASKRPEAEEEERKYPSQPRGAVP